MKKNVTKKKAEPKKSSSSKRKITKAPKAAPIAPVVQAAPETVEPTNSITTPARKESKKDIAIRLLQRDGGATLPELMTATGWQAHSVRGFISGTLKTKLGMTITRSEGNRYRTQAGARQ